MRMVMNESQIMEKGKHPDTRYFVAYTESEGQKPRPKESGPNQKPLTIKPYPG
jgi:hypothetical protein